MFDLNRRRVLESLGLGGIASVAGCSGGAVEAPQATAAATTTTASGGSNAKELDAAQVAADPTAIPDPIDRSEPTTHEITLTYEEVTAEIEPGVTFNFMTFDGRIPGPMVRIRQGDTVELTVENLDENTLQHNVDFHAVYGTGGGSVATTAAPGKANALQFRAEYPGAFIYHCAVPNLDMHISSGMFGMILVEPADGLPAVDREFYFGQHEIYTDKQAGEEGAHAFNMGSMANEQPTYVVLNGEKYAWAAAARGPLEVEQGETVRVYLVNGGPNLSSNFHPIGNVWTRAYRDGGLPTDEDLAQYADKNIQTMTVPPGSCMVGEMDTPVPERIKLVDHALSRVVRKGLLAEVDVVGEENEAVYDPDFNDSSHQGPQYGG